MTLREIFEIRDSCVMQYEIDVYSIDDICLNDYVYFTYEPYDSHPIFEEIVYNFEPRKRENGLAYLYVRMERTFEDFEKEYSVKKIKKLKLNEYQIMFLHLEEKNIELVKNEDDCLSFKLNYSFVSNETYLNFNLETKKNIFGYNITIDDKKQECIGITFKENELINKIIEYIKENN